MWTVFVRGYLEEEVYPNKTNAEAIKMVAETQVPSNQGPVIVWAQDGERMLYWDHTNDWIKLDGKPASEDQGLQRVNPR